MADLSESPTRLSDSSDDSSPTISPSNDPHTHALAASRPEQAERAASEASGEAGRRIHSADNRPGRVDPELAHLQELHFPERYQTRAVLGEGGMGEVRLVSDHRMGRDVAMKVIKPIEGTSKTEDEIRFVREACIQGQLEHPSIVPVYDLGLSPGGDAYFTMRRVRGLTVKEVVRGLADEEPSMLARFSRRKLLTAFSNVCLTVAYVHEKGVIHRDLKPANIMLGDFGEVYLLDWGLAKLVSPLSDGSSRPIVHEDDAPATTIGTLLGTTGYMAPEQARGLFDLMDHRADIYSLGAILFELLALEPLIPKSTRAEMIDATLAGADARASVRAPDKNVPPELEAICVRATALDPTDRYATARQLHDAIERYLDGDRDLERRRETASIHARTAEELVDRILSGAADEESARSKAMREAGRALALDPDNETAMHTMVRLLLEPPKTPPKTMLEEMEREREATLLASGRAGLLAYLAWFFFAPVFVAMGIRDFTLASLPWVGAGLAVAVNLLGVHVKTFRPWRGLMSITASGLAIAACSRVFGPLVFVPALATANTLAYMLTPHRTKHGWIVSVGCLSLVAPAVLEWIGVLPRSYVWTNGTMCIVPQMTSLPEVYSSAFLLVTAVGGIAVAGLYLHRVQRTLAAAQERLHVQSWHLRQLIPVRMRSR